MPGHFGFYLLKILSLALAVEGTPYFLVNNLVVRGALPQDLFKSAIEMALSNSK